MCPCYILLVLTESLGRCVKIIHFVARTDSTPLSSGFVTLNSYISQTLQYIKEYYEILEGAARWRLHKGCHQMSILKAHVGGRASLTLSTGQTLPPGTGI
jgi:hypothetical protein